MAPKTNMSGVEQDLYDQSLHLTSHYILLDHHFYN